MVLRYHGWGFAHSFSLILGGGEDMDRGGTQTPANV